MLNQIVCFHDTVMSATEFLQGWVPVPEPPLSPGLSPSLCPIPARRLLTSVECLNSRFFGSLPDVPIETGPGVTTCSVSVSAWGDTWDAVPSCFIGQLLFLLGIISQFQILFLYSHPCPSKSRPIIWLQSCSRSLGVSMELLVLTFFGLVQLHTPWRFWSKLV